MITALNYSIVLSYYHFSLLLRLIDYQSLEHPKLRIHAQLPYPFKLDSTLLQILFINPSLTLALHHNNHYLTIQLLKHPQR